LNSVKTFYSLLGKVLGLAIVGSEAYAQSNAGGASSLLQPENLAALIAEVEGVLAPAAAAPAVAPSAVTTAVSSSAAGAAI
jgi:hypothetical protein